MQSTRTCLAAAALAIGAALAGCATPVPATQGGIAVPAAWHGGLPASPAALADWWQGFGDPWLPRLVRAAEQANTDVAAAQAALRRARALREAAGAALVPTATASVSAQRSRTAVGNSGNLFDAGFDAAWEPDLFGGNRHAAAAARADERASAATLAGTQVSVAAEVAVSYLQLRGTQARLAVARENLAAQRQTLQIAQWRAQAGVGSSLDVLQARSAAEQTQAQLPLLQASEAQLAHAISVLTGEPPATLLPELQLPAPLPQAPQGLTLAIPAQVLRQRPDVLAAEQQLQAAAERVAEADAARLPVAQLRASLAWSALTLGSLGSSAAAHTLLGSVSQPLFDGGQRRAQRDAQQAAFDAARESYRARVLGALQEVEDTLAALRGARERSASLATAADAARQAALLATQRQASGLIDFQTVLDTQRTLLSAQDALASAETELAVDHVRLYKALGGGWTPTTPLLQESGS